MLRRILQFACVAFLTIPTLASAQIVGSAHDLSNGSIGAAADTIANGGTDQICIFCHVPHNARTQALIWNHNDGANGGFAAGATTMSGTTTVANPAPTAMYFEP